MQFGHSDAWQRTSGVREPSLSHCDYGRMLEALSILPEKQGRSQAALLAAGVSQGELGAASVRSHSVNAECLGILTFWNRNSETGKVPLSQSYAVRRPRGHKCNFGEKPFRQVFALYCKYLPVIY